MRESSSQRPPLLLTMGDPCGIGPEVIARAFATGRARGCAVVADVDVMRRAVRTVGALLPVVPVSVLQEVDEVPAGAMPVWSPSGLPADLTGLPVGTVQAAAGAAAAACIRAAAGHVQAGQGSALVTAPIHKEALAAAGLGFPGHTEMLQSLAGGVPVRMMLANDELKTVLVSIHVSLRDAIERVTVDNVLDTLRIAHHSARRWGLAAPRIGVAGLNPHAGEGGLFGHEEQQVIAPAVAAARREGIDARGPFAPDTVFMRARHAEGHPGEFDLVIAMYHDQGLIPVKYLGLDRGVNVTLGLPFVRTSPDHGTAFEIAGTGRADASSFEAAIDMARRLLQPQP